MAQWQWHLTRETFWHSGNDILLEENSGTVTVTLYSRKILAQWQWPYCCKILKQWQWHNTREKYCHSEWRFIQGRQLISVRTLQVCWSILEIFVTQAFHAKPFMNCAFYGSRCHERHTWLEGANNIFPRFLHILSDSYKIRRTRCARKFVKWQGRFMKIGLVNAIRHWRSITYF